MEFGFILAILGAVTGLFSLVIGIKISSRCSGKLRTVVMLVCAAALILAVDNILKVFNLVPLFEFEALRNIGEIAISLLIFTSFVIFHSMTDDIEVESTEKKR